MRFPSLIRKWPIPCSILILCVTAAFFRFYLFKSVPPGLFYDEGLYGVNAAEALRTGHYQIFYQDNFGREGLYINIQSFFLWLFNSHAAWVLRLESAITGLLTIPGLFLVGLEIGYLQKLKKPIVFATAASFFLAVSFWHIMFSRIGFSGILAPFFMVWWLYFFLQSLRKKSWILALLSGIILGVGFNSYLAFRIAPIVILPLLPFIWQTKQLRQCIAWIAGIALGIYPLALYFLRNPNDFSSRTSVISVFRADNVWHDLSINIYSAISMLTFHGDDNWRHNISGQPQLWLPLSILLVIGVYVASTHRTKGHTLVLIWLLAGLLPMILAATKEGMPHALRSIMSIPAVYLLVASGFYFLYEKSLTLPYKAKISTLILLGIILPLGNIYTTYHQYFTIWANNPEVATAFNLDIFTRKAEALLALPSYQTKYVIVGDWPSHTLEDMPLGVRSFLFQINTYSIEDAARKNIIILNAKDTNKITHIPENAPRFTVQ